MYTAKIRNANGELLTLNGKENRWQIISITGLNPPPAQINTTPIAGMDGAKLNSTKLEPRNIVILLKINGVWSEVEENRQFLYRYFRTKGDCVFYFKNKNLDVSIPGVVETVECDLFKNGEQMQISIICPFPYFESLQKVIADVSNIVAGFTFPFSIDYDDPIPFSIYERHNITNVLNDSESETGVRILVDILDDVQDIKIVNTITGEFVEVEGEYTAGDRITINTQKGRKSVYLLRDGETTNIFGDLVDGSTFFQLKPGDNNFSYLADNGESDTAVFITFEYSHLYRGV